ncbi:uncharacterized protein CANTADRAFT_91650 [Suhomyces tanzawaensis NRRL Y-17324]|uniref:Uncharacterized protein n=1 Tax=Suhomyces tanzawaensis NRRL Y-17324 TaxID=984487 RepID=A0A1E4SFJ0_9ASCO|nr:uncharacterized protein CANTADRAFT_91650 [Suhomyces tanzawaensis NRRL Y-17324]ODV78230.1 hypothetical protein CANTADRAFT_91650 [Suhomyces tanzawaensis NRRL Y-17324]
MPFKRHVIHQQDLQFSNFSAKKFMGFAPVVENDRYQKTCSSSEKLLGEIHR